jgi:hypothetical protein
MFFEIAVLVERASSSSAVLIRSRGLGRACMDRDALLA